MLCSAGAASPYPLTRHSRGGCKANQPPPRWSDWRVARRYCLGIPQRNVAVGLEQALVVELQTVDVSAGVVIAVAAAAHGRLVTGELAFATHAPTGSARCT